MILSASTRLNPSPPLAHHTRPQLTCTPPVPSQLRQDPRRPPAPQRPPGHEDGGLDVRVCAGSRALRPPPRAHPHIASRTASLTLLARRALAEGRPWPRHGGRGRQVPHECAACYPPNRHVPVVLAPCSRARFVLVCAERYGVTVRIRSTSAATTRAAARSGAPRLTVCTCSVRVCSPTCL